MTGQRESNDRARSGDTDQSSDPQRRVTPPRADARGAQPPRTLAPGEVYVLFLCVGNSCRSQMAEALLQRLGKGRFDAYSAGANPAGFVHPLAIEAMKSMGIDTSNHESKSLQDVADMPFHVVITLCDPLAPDDCPTWRGAPIVAHWPMPDPAFHPGTPEERLTVAQAVARRLEHKIKALVELDFAQDKAKLQAQLAHLGEI